MVIMPTSLQTEKGGNFLGVGGKVPLVKVDMVYSPNLLSVAQHREVAVRPRFSFSFFKDVLLRAFIVPQNLSPAW